jgi:hypothetical protein
LGGLADLVGDLGADLVIEQVLEREPGAREIEENLIEAWVLVRFVDRPAGVRAAISTEVLGEHSADEFARGNSPGPRYPLDSFEEFRRHAPYMESRPSDFSSLVCGVHAVHFNDSVDLG